MAIIIACFFICIIWKVFSILIGNGNPRGHRDIDSRDSRRQMIAMAMDKAEDYNASSFQVGRTWIGDDGHEYIDCSITVSDDVAMALAHDLRDEYGDVIEKIGITYNNNDMKDEKGSQPSIYFNGPNNGTVYGDVYWGCKKTEATPEGEYAEYEEEVPEASATANDMPEVLQTEDAMVYWQRLQNAGFVDVNFQPIGLNKAQMMYIADCMSDKLRLRYKWSPFEKLWHVTRLADAKYEMMRTGDVPARSSDILSIF